jgi:hypothetical protein
MIVNLAVIITWLRLVAGLNHLMFDNHPFRVSRIYKSRLPAMELWRRNFDQYKAVQAKQAQGFFKSSDAYSPSIGIVLVLARAVC